MIFNTTYEKNNHSFLAQLKEANKYLPWINEAAKKYSFQPSVIAGVASRESHWGLALNPEGPEGTGDFAERNPKLPARHGKLPPDGRGFGRGLMQVDFDWHEFARTGKWMDPRENILYGCKILADCLRFMSSSGNPRVDAGLGHDFPERETLRAVLAAYNAGSSRTIQAIREGVDVDINTSGHNYSADVLNRAGWFQLQGWS